LTLDAQLIYIRRIVGKVGIIAHDGKIRNKIGRIFGF